MYSFHSIHWGITFIQQGINYRNITLNIDVEVVLVDIWVDKTRTKIINFYSLYEGGNGKVILCGDFNAHNTVGRNKSG